MTTVLQGAQNKMVNLSVLMSRAGEVAVTLTEGQPGWTDWIVWRENNGLGTGFMKLRKRWGVPSKYPPTSGIDTALAEYGAGTTKRRK